jgi:hypothetical protein
MLTYVLPSKLMEDRDEHNKIRISRPGRKLLGVELKNTVVTEIDKESNLPAERRLIVKMPFKDDIYKFKSSTNKAKSKALYGFVSKTIFAELVDFNRFLVGKGKKISLIGTDPEFCLVQRGEELATYAQHAIPTSGKQARFGHDGPCAEVRPEPAARSIDLVRNIVDCFKIGVEKNYHEKFKWVGGCVVNGKDGRVYTIGGHIHISDPIGINIAEDHNKEIRRFIVRTLDELIGIPIAAFEGTQGYIRRTTKPPYNNYYGSWGDYRESKNRFEWRSLSGVWLISPSLAKAVLEISSALANGIYTQYLCRYKEEGFCIKNWVDEMSKALLTIDYKTIQRYNALLQTIGSNRKIGSPEFDKALSGLKSARKFLQVSSSSASEFNLFEEVTKRSISDYNINTEINGVWVGDTKDPITDGPLSSVIGSSKPQSKEKPYKIIEVTQKGDKKGHPVLDNGTEYEDENYDEDDYYDEDEDY